MSRKLQISCKCCSKFLFLCSRRHSSDSIGFSVSCGILPILLRFFLVNVIVEQIWRQLELNSHNKFGCDAKWIYSLWANLSSPLLVIPSHSFLFGNSTVRVEVHTRADSPEPVPSLKKGRAVKYKTDTGRREDLRVLRGFWYERIWPYAYRFQLCFWNKSAWQFWGFALFKRAAIWFTE